MTKKSAFTLVELLVVIAIITILAAMLLPTLERGLDSARTQNCANNEKQIFMGFQEYCDSYASALPRCNSYLWTGSWTNNKSWVYIMRYELSSALIFSGANCRVNPNGFLRCASNEKGIDTSFQAFAMQEGTSGNYGMNSYGLGGFLHGLSKPIVYTRLSQVKIPSKQIGFGDIDYIKGIEGMGGHFPYGNIGYWHNIKSCTNSLFLDGHIKTHDLYSVKNMCAEENFPNPSTRTAANIMQSWWSRLPWGNY